MAQTAEAEVVVVRMQLDGTPPYAAIARGAAKPELVRKDRALDEAVFYQQIIAKLYQEGYLLKSTMAAGDLHSAVLIFSKGK